MLVLGNRDSPAIRSLSAIVLTHVEPDSLPADIHSSESPSRSDIKQNRYMPPVQSQQECPLQFKKVAKDVLHVSIDPLDEILASGSTRSRRPLPSASRRWMDSEDEPDTEGIGEPAAMEEDHEDDPLALRPGQVINDPIDRRAFPTSIALSAPPPIPSLLDISAHSEEDLDAPVPTSDDEEMMLDRESNERPWMVAIESLAKRRAEMDAVAEVDMDGRAGENNVGMSSSETSSAQTSPLAITTTTIPDPNAFQDLSSPQPSVIQVIQRSHSEPQTNLDEAKDSPEQQKKAEGPLLSNADVDMEEGVELLRTVGNDVSSSRRKEQSTDVGSDKQVQLNEASAPLLQLKEVSSSQSNITDPDFPAAVPSISQDLTTLRARTRSPSLEGQTLGSLAHLGPRRAISPLLEDTAMEVERDRSPSLTPPPVVPLLHLASLIPTSPAQPANQSIPTPPPPKSPSDPLLDAFRSVRTFRTRTAIQLQPYTREKKKYTEMVRTGGRRLIEELMGDDPDKEVLEKRVEEESLEETPFGVYREGLAEEDETQESPEIDMAISITPLVDVEDEDYDSYFSRYGEIAESPSDGRLQALARKRIRLRAAEARKTARDDKAAKRQQVEEERRVQKEMLEQRRAERERQRIIAERKKRDKEERKRAREVDVPVRLALRSDSEEEERPLLQTASKKRKKTPRSAPIDPDDEEKPLARTGFRGHRGSGSSKRMSPTPDLDRGRGGDDTSSPFSLDALPDLEQDDDPMSMSMNALSDDEVEVLGVRGRRRPMRGTDSDSEPAATAVPKKKVKVLKRVLPAFMIKKLATDQAKKDRARDRAIGDAPDRTPRTGKRTTRRTADAADMADWFDDNSLAVEPLAGADPLDGPEDVPVLGMFSSDSEMSLLSLSDDDPIDEDAAESVRMLNHGDFDRLLYGGGRMRPVAAETGVPTKTIIHRTALGRSRPLPKRLRQTGLHFPASRRGHGGVQHRPKKRIVMDDETIFERSSAPRQALRPLLAPAQAHLAVGPARQGRAPPRLAKRSSPAVSAASDSPTARRSDPAPVLVGDEASAQVSHWDEIKEFQVDFEVRPLASGVSFDPLSFSGSGKLRKLMRRLRGEEEELALPRLQTLEAYGLVLPLIPNEQELRQCLPIIQDGIAREFTSLSGDQALDKDPRAVQLLDYLVNLGGIADVVSASTLDILDSLTSILADFRLATASRSHRANSDTLLQVGWSLVAALWRWYKVADPVLAKVAILPLIATASESLMLKLLQHGLNRTMKPLKEVMAFLAESPVIKDISAECWVMLLHTLRFAELTMDMDGIPSPISFQATLETALGEFMPDHDRNGPRASEKLWYLAFGLASLCQFDENGVTRDGLESIPLWFLVRRALSAIALPQMTEEEELRKRHHLRTRDRYVKIMIVRCLRLNSVWQWHCNKESFQIATKDLGTVFKDRHHRNFPSEVSSDFPAFISEYDLTKTEEIDMDDSAYNLYLRLLAGTASDMVAAASTVAEAESMVKEVQRLMLSIFPFSAVSLLPGAIPSSRQTAALINRYSTAVIAGLFVPSLLSWLLNNAGKWFDFRTAHIEIRRIVIRGLMYLAVASRHHGAPLKPVIDRLAEAFESVRSDRDKLKEGDVERTTLSRLLVLMIGGFRHIIQTSSFRRDVQGSPVYPDPILLHQCWTGRLKSTELVTDRRAGNEIVDCIQAFLNARHAAMPSQVKRNRASKLEDESQGSGFDDFGIDFTDEDVLALGGGVEAVAPEFAMDQEVATRLATHISPGLYDLLSNTFSASEVTALSAVDQADRQIYISKLTKCWADCAGVLVVDHREREWSTYMGEYGTESWERFGDEQGRKQIGLSFMLNVARLDPNVFSSHSEEFIKLFIQALAANLITVEPQYVAAVMAMPGAKYHPILQDLDLEGSGIFDRASFGHYRTRWLRMIFANFARLLNTPRTQSSMKVFIYRSMNLLIAAMISNYQLISISKVAQRAAYSSTCDEIIRDIKQEAGEHFNEMSVPKLKSFPLHRPVVDIVD